MTLFSLASATYGASSTIGIDLIDESNSQIPDFDHLVPGQRIELPPLARETLTRRQSDGTYRLILGTFLDRKRAEKVAQQFAAETGRATGVTPRKVTPNLLLHRVEMWQLTEADLDDAWKEARRSGLASIARRDGEPRRIARAER
jgi:hypothetical protein